MGFHAKWTSTCDYCGRQAIVELTPEQDSLDNYFDPWGPGWPEGWTQDNRNDKYFLWCTHQCLQEWLVKNGYPDEADGIYIA